MPLYALVGALATAVHYLVLVMLVELAGVPAGVAAATGALAGALAAYAGNRRFTFASRAAHTRALPRFLAVAALGAVTSAAVVLAGTEWLGLHYLLPQAVATLIVLVFGYALNRRWTFA
ncbi:MAG: GtrA family protein [Gammaproteobacteria bacterium]|nr:GtrA family protein [Gammaproteobacteria bacterium]